MDNLNKTTIKENILNEELKVDKKSFFIELNNLISHKINQTIFIQKIQNFMDAYKYHEKGEDFFKTERTHKEMGELMNEIIQNISNGEYGFFNTNNSEDITSINEYKLINLKKNDLLRVEMFIDHLAMGEFEKANELNIKSDFEIEHQSENQNLHFIIMKFLMDSKNKNNDIHNKFLKLFYSEKEWIAKIVTDAINDRFSEKELENISYESYVEFYGHVLSEIKNEILFDNGGWGDLVFQVQTKVNGIPVDAQFYPSTEFRDIQGAIENVIDILETAKKLQSTSNDE